MNDTGLAMLAYAHERLALISLSFTQGYIPAIYKDKNSIRGISAHGSQNRLTYLSAPSGSPVKCQVFAICM